MKETLKTITATIALFYSATLWAELPHITNLRINPTPPGAKVSAAFLSMHNPSDEELTLFGASSPLISRVEIHKSTIENDVAMMRKQEAIKLNADESVTFKHGGLHIMLMGLDAPMMPGDKIPLTFHTSFGDITIDAQVAESIALPSDGSHADMNHDNPIEHDAKTHDDSTQENSTQKH